MSKLKVAVLFGGVSSEHEVSLQSAASIIENIPADRYEVIQVGITKKGRWLYYPDVYKRQSPLRSECPAGESSPCTGSPRPT